MTAALSSVGFRAVTQTTNGPPRHGHRLRRISRAKSIALAQQVEQFERSAGVP
jgi:hypothetical protein